MIEALDEDTTSSDLLGKTKGIPYTELIKSTEKQTAKYELFIKDTKKVGEVVVTWTYHWEEPDFEP